MAQQENQWHLDKRVPIALIIALVAQSAGAVWWASSMSERMDQAERWMGGAAVRSQEADRAISNQAAQIAVLIEQMTATNRSLDRLYAQVSDTNDLIRNMIQGQLRGPRGTAP